jgi:oligosaccharide repeat unit polymerase
MSLSVALATALVVLATAFALVRWPLLHPVPLWLIPWAAALMGYSTHLLPFRTLSISTSLYITVGVAGFAAATIAGSKMRMRAAPRSPGPLQVDARVRPVAISLSVIATAWFVAFLIAAVKTVGLRDAFISSPSLREAISQGTMAVEIKYLYATYAALAAVGVWLGQSAPSRKIRYALAGTGVLGSAMSYFSTGRANVVTGLIILGVAWSIARGTISRRAIVASAVAVIVFAGLVFAVGGQLIGKTYGHSEISTIDSVFARNSWLQPGALPYLYLTAPIPALDIEANDASTVGETAGCATFTPICAVLDRGGLPVNEVPQVRPFTARPLPWNTYTALEAPLRDGGWVFAVPILALLGFGIGRLWCLATVGRRAIFIMLYSVWSPALIFGAGSNAFAGPQFVGAALMLLATWGLVRWRQGWS